MHKTKSGFTLVELLIVIVVIAILAAITLVAYNGIQAKARDSARKSDLSSIAKLLSMYSIDNGPMWTGSGCGSGGNGNGFFNAYVTSAMDCLKNAGVTSSTIIDPSGTVTCAGGDTDCETYMKYTCKQSGATVTYIYANLETGTHNGDEVDETCATNLDTTYGMNYYVKITPSS